jgi:hypothetical protein
METEILSAYLPFRVLSFSGIGACSAIFRSSSEQRAGFISNG